MESSWVPDGAIGPLAVDVVPIELTPAEVADGAGGGASWLSSGGIGACVTVTVMVTEWDRNVPMPIAPDLPVMVMMNVVVVSGLVSGSTKHRILTVAPGINWVALCLQ